MDAAEALMKLEGRCIPIVDMEQATAIQMAVRALAEKVDREAEKKPNGPALLDMSEAVDLMAKQFEGEVNRDGVAAASVLRKLDEWFKGSNKNSPWFGNQWWDVHMMRIELGLPERSP